MRLTTTTGNCKPLRFRALRRLWYLPGSALQKTTPACSRSASERHSEVDAVAWNTCPALETASHSCVASDSSSPCRMKFVVGTLLVNITILQQVNSSQTLGRENWRTGLSTAKLILCWLWFLVQLKLLIGAITGRRYLLRQAFARGNPDFVPLLRIVLPYLDVQ